MRNSSDVCERKSFLKFHTVRLLHNAQGEGGGLRISFLGWQTESGS